MTTFKILAVLAVLLALLCLTRIGAVFCFGDSLSVTVKIGPTRIRVFPLKKKKTPHKKEKRQRNTEKSTETKPKKPFPKPNGKDILDAVKTLWPPLMRTLNRTRRGVRVNPLDVAVVLGGQEEPADTAEMYGMFQAAIWAGMPILERLLVIPHPHIHMDVDFAAEKHVVSGTAGVSARIGTLLGIGVSMAVPGLKWLLAYRKKKQTPVGKDEFNGHGKEKPAA